MPSVDIMFFEVLLYHTNYICQEGYDFIQLRSLVC